MSCRHSTEAAALSRDFAARLLSSLGLVSALAGCGGLVVYVEDDGEGAGGAGGGAPGVGGFPNPVGGSGPVGGSSTWPCEPSVGVDQEAVYKCIPLDDGCPAAGSGEAHAQLSDELSWESCDKFCCDGASVDSVPCGPDPSVPSQCCYIALVSYHSECMGRPFTVLGEARTASPIDSESWSNDTGLDVASLESATRQALCAAFTKSALYEHASVASFARFALDLLSMGAPASLLRGAQQAMADEIDHAEICFGLAARYGGAPLGPGPLACNAPARRSHEQVLTEVVIEGCIGETIAALLAARARDIASDAAVKAALTRIAEDEARHAELSWKTIAWALAQDRPSWRAAIETALHDVDIRVPSPCEPPGIDRAAWQAHGQLTQRESADVVEAARVHVVLACARDLLAAPQRVSASPRAAPHEPASPRRVSCPRLARTPLG